MNVSLLDQIINSNQSQPHKKKEHVEYRQCKNETPHLKKRNIHPNQIYDNKFCPYYRKGSFSRNKCFKNIEFAGRRRRLVGG